ATRCMAAPATICSTVAMTRPPTPSTSAGDVLQFGGQLDLTAAGVAGRIAGIETLTMTNPHGGDQLKLSAHDALDLGEVTFSPGRVGELGPGHAVRVDGHDSDQLTLSGGNWSRVDTHNAPAGYEVLAPTRRLATPSSSSRRTSQFTLPDRCVSR